MNNISKNKPRAEPGYKLGIALSGGGVKGVSHAGALKALEEYGIKPDVISGVSSGAIVAALYADGHSPEEITSFFDKMTFTKMTSIQLGDGGFFSMKSFEKFLSGKLRAKIFAELPFALRIVATNLDQGRSVAFSSGNLVEPVIASSSMPVLFAPKIIEGANYVDGGVLKNFPVSTIRDECRYVVGINCSPMVADDYSVNIINVATRSYHFMFRANTLHDRELCDLLIEPKEVANYDTFDADKSREIFEIGYKTTVEMLESEEGKAFLDRLKAGE
jgi:NTE family protein